MITTHKQGALTWVDVENPTIEDVKTLVDKYHVHSIIGEEMLVPTLRAKVDYYPGHMYLILHFPTLSQGKKEGHTKEIDFIIGKDFLITAHYEHIPALFSFVRSFETCSILERGCGFDHAGALFFYMVRELYKDVESGIDSIARKMKDVEENVFRGREGQMVTHISSIGREILHFKEATRFHKEVLESYAVAGKKMFGIEYESYAESLLGDYYKVWNIIENQKDLLGELRDTNDSLLSFKSNDVMKTLTVVAFIVLPMTLVSQIFSMGVGRLPLSDNPYAFYIILLFMILIGVLSYAYFRFKKWL